MATLLPLKVVCPSNGPMVCNSCLTGVPMLIIGVSQGGPKVDFLCLKGGPELGAGGGDNSENVPSR